MNQKNNFTKTKLNGLNFFCNSKKKSRCVGAKPEICCGCSKKYVIDKCHLVIELASIHTHTHGFF